MQAPGSSYSQHASHSCPYPIRTQTLLLPLFQEALPDKHQHVSSLKPQPLSTGSYCPASALFFQVSRLPMAASCCLPRLSILSDRPRGPTGVPREYARLPRANEHCGHVTTPEPKQWKLNTHTGGYSLRKKCYKLPFLFFWVGAAGVVSPQLGRGFAHTGPNSGGSKPRLYIHPFFFFLITRVP